MGVFIGYHQNYTIFQRQASHEGVKSELDCQCSVLPEPLPQRHGCSQRQDEEELCQLEHDMKNQRNHKFFYFSGEKCCKIKLYLFSCPSLRTKLRKNCECLTSLIQQALTGRLWAPLQGDRGKAGARSLHKNPELVAGMTQK